MSSTNTGGLRNEKTVDMCALVQRGCKPGCKHSKSLKGRAAQVNRSVQSAFALMSLSTNDEALLTGPWLPLNLFKFGLF